ncbi:sulfate adenylyltransferase subunit CysN [Pararhizobium haloflavum]|uniref:sulfate adenylyltransferase subunit CysN n=1 Tax=Pararhizobium haloflavum TaxID=2037914 RepID=UPI000C187B8B|nr:sulfate adenylyltransferase subunit CysN [Pararhizobium haloflavum]
MRAATSTALQVEDDTIEDVADYLTAQERKSFLRFLTCGSVDDGKSTLIGRLLYDTKLIFEDQLAALERDSRKHGTTGEDIDFALLVDGLEAEREQGITIDVAYRFFATDKRKFIVADTPGHEQYTRNMATGASTADLAIVLVDARQGILTQTRRHTYIASLLGIRHIVVAINKIDLVDFSESTFAEISDAYLDFARDLGFHSIVAIPLSARYGDNVTAPSERTPWYRGPALLEHLETVEAGDDDVDRAFRFPVQYVSRPNLDFRGFAGQVASGAIRVGDEVVVAKSGVRSRVRRIVTRDGDLETVREGQSVTIVLEDEVDCSRGDMLVPVDSLPAVADRFDARIVWFAEKPLEAGRQYILRTETDQTPVTVTALRHRIGINDFEARPADELEINAVGVVDLAAQQPIAFDPYETNRQTGAFILIDRISNQTVGAGMIGAASAPSRDTGAGEVSQKERATIKHQKPAILWLTGLSGSGKSTLAKILERRLHTLGLHTYVLDGANTRHGINKGLGFTPEDRLEEAHRVANVARLMADAGLVVIVSFISPFRAERQLARDIAGDNAFLEVHVDATFEDCARRDPKGFYRMALEGQLKNFTGVDEPYEAPDAPDIHLDVAGKTPEALALEVEAVLKAKSLL